MWQLDGTHSKVGYIQQDYIPNNYGTSHLSRSGSGDQKLIITRKKEDDTCRWRRTQFRPRRSPRRSGLLAIIESMIQVLFISSVYEALEACIRRVHPLES